MEKFNALNQAILDDDGSSNLEGIMKEILKEILIEKEQEEAKNRKRTYTVDKQSHDRSKSKNNSIS